MNIPVFHDDQHGTAIVVAAALTNGLRVTKRDIKNVKMVVSGAGAAALACLDLLVDLGLPLRNIWVTDIAGVVYEGRTELMDEDKARFAQPTSARTLDDIIEGADIFLGLSAGGVLKPEMVQKMAPSPLIFALANPNPEILPELALEVRPDAILATGLKIAPAVAQAAQTSGVAIRPIEDLEAYRQHLQQFVYQSGTLMKPVFSLAKAVPAEKKRIVFAEGEEERVLRALQVIVDEGIASPILIGRPAVIAQRIARYSLRLVPGRDFTIVNPEQDERYRDYWQTYHRLMQRRGITAQLAKVEMRRRTTLIGAMLLHKKEADGMICGTISTPHRHLHFIDQVIGKRPGCSVYAAMNGLILPGRQIFLVDTHINIDPSPDQLAEITCLAAEEVRRFGIEPKIALVSHSNFGSSPAASAQKMRDVLARLQEIAPDLEVDGEMHGDCALDAQLRKEVLPDCILEGDANVLVMPNIDAANISYNLLKTIAGNNIAIGPILLGAAKPVHILTASATVRRVINMTALVVADAAAR
ncbi:hypothetical protein BGZ92_011403 [Podila epicladia]|nr:hypothetical protein BGZ92_011403 [Podila epicladia]